MTIFQHRWSLPADENLPDVDRQGATAPAILPEIDDEAIVGIYGIRLGSEPILSVFHSVKMHLPLLKDSPRYPVIRAPMGSGTRVVRAEAPIPALVPRPEIHRPGLSIPRVGAGKLSTCPDLEGPGEWHVAGHRMKSLLVRERIHGDGGAFGKNHLSL